MSDNPDKLIAGLDLPRMIRFVFWGSLNTIISYLVYCVFVYAGAHIFLASLFSLIAGILLGHFFNKNNVFRSDNQNTLPKYFVIWGALYLVHIGLLALLTHWGMGKYLAGAVAGALLVPVSYGLLKIFVFHDK